MQRGLYHLIGCRTTVLAVTWSQPWTPNPPSLGEQVAVLPMWPVESKAHSSFVLPTSSAPSGVCCTVLHSIGCVKQMVLSTMQASSCTRGTAGAARRKTSGAQQRRGSRWSRRCRCCPRSWTHQTLRLCCPQSRRRRWDPPFIDSDALETEVPTTWHSGNYLSTNDATRAEWTSRNRQLFLCADAVAATSQAPGAQAGRPKRADVHAAPQSVTVRAARGQLLAWGLRLANRGRLPVTAAQATVVVPDMPGARPG
jgi:hypothetical protein